MRVLVAFETGHGTTQETAEAVAEVMRERGADVDFMRCRKVESLDGYDAVVVAAPIWFMTYLRPARTFLTRHEEELAQMPVAMCFASLSGSIDKYQKDVDERIRPKVLSIAPSVEPVDCASLPGVISYPKYNAIMRQWIRALIAVSGGPTSGVTDYRDWDAIREWAARMYDEFARRLGETTG